MRIVFLGGAFLLGAAALRAAVAPAMPFPQAGSDLAPDPAARFGQLDNGLQYVVLTNPEPHGRVALRLLVRAGSGVEADDESGLAHFVEHLAFRGSAHYPTGTLVEACQRMGLVFGTDTNATTTFDRTLYSLDLPDNGSGMIEEALTMLGDFADGLLFDPAAIERERGVVLRECHARDTVDARILEARYKAMLGTLRLPVRLPVGNPAVIAHVTRERLVAFWRAWYRPERMAVLAVGDLEPEATVRAIAQHFGGLRACGPPRPEPPEGTVEQFQGIRALFHVEREAPAASIAIATTTLCRTDPDSREKRRSRLRRHLAFMMLNSRLAGLTRMHETPITEADACFVQRSRDCVEASVDLACPGDDWAAALATGEQQLRGALEFGFQPVELAMATNSVRRSLVQAVGAASNRRSAALATALAESLVEGEVFLHPRAEAELLSPELERVTLAECTDALRAAFDGNGRHVMLSGNFTATEDPLATINEVYTISAQAVLRPHKSPRVAPWAYAATGEPGRVVSRERIDDLDLTLVTFANGVRLNLRPTKFETDRIRFQARVGNGAMSEPAGRRGLAWLATDAFIAGGLKKHSVVEYSRILAGRCAMLTFSAMTPDAFVFRGATTGNDLTLALELLTAYLTAPGFRPEALERSRKNLDRLYNNFENTAEGPLVTEVANLLAGGDPRFGLPPREEMLLHDMGELRRWLEPELTRGAVELVMVGDLDVEQTVAAVARTLGTMRPRTARALPPDRLRLAFPPHPFAVEYAIGATEADGRLAVYWPTPDATDPQRECRLGLLASVLRDSLRDHLRDQLGVVYSPRVASRASDVFPDYGYLEATLDVEPARLQFVADQVVALAAELGRNGVSAGQLVRARQPALAELRNACESNAYWVGSLACVQTRPDTLARVRVRERELADCTAADLSRLAAACLLPQRASRVVLLPGSPHESDRQAGSTSTAAWPAPQP